MTLQVSVEHQAFLLLDAVGDLLLSATEGLRRGGLDGQYAQGPPKTSCLLTPALLLLVPHHAPFCLATTPLLLPG